MGSSSSEMLLWSYVYLFTLRHSISAVSDDAYQHAALALFGKSTLESLKHEYLIPIAHPHWNMNSALGMRSSLRKLMYKGHTYYWYKPKIFRMSTEIKEYLFTFIRIILSQFQFIIAVELRLQ